MRLTLNRVTRYLNMLKRVNDLLMKLKTPNRNYQIDLVNIESLLLNAEARLRTLQQRIVKDQEVK